MTAFASIFQDIHMSSKLKSFSHFTRGSGAYDLVHTLSLSNCMVKFRKQSWSWLKETNTDCWWEL